MLVGVGVVKNANKETVKIFVLYGGHMNLIKKVIGFTAASACALVLSACGSSGILAPKAPDLNKQFDMTADVVCGDSSFSLTMSRTSVGRWRVVLNEPYEVQGVTFGYAKDGVTAALDGVGVDEITSDFGASPIAVMINAFESVIGDNNAAVTYLDGGYRVSSGDCVLSFENGSSNPVGFEIPKEKISGKVSEFTVTGELFKDGADVVVIW